MRTKARLMAGTTQIDVLDDPAVVRINGELTPITHLLWLHQTGRWPREGYTIVQVDGDSSNYRFSNLREVPIVEALQ